ncbi:Crp/Fnr family transcriptional regulator [Salmonella enterica subsp. enterica serovar Carmel]|uniref:Crp/Fnr family transcriptional regulator n=1 Tax=Salmonella enterica TaxID=28901 RepID=A0A742XHP0_SALER|nr:Crp/Fnr family transcriptional regulator [Salmonella enterica subsp. enterica serovar Carmel]EDP8967065.1 Crp/Fnr family transcriptional regulator [Salmonella enterica subsp. enterica]HAF1734848.1 Crp/Fnr family transcriptional regulator [Salmonella enterica]ECD4289690.1 Crp/Fnr family transcriptional regulator [Salmonella enterica subsp. enterica serovar Carmel]ECF3809088.1 Crp/Fnr family transcriptional regulator [Salmonella enterica subsp. enterica serovar Carmel]
MQGLTQPGGKTSNAFPRRFTNSCRTPGCDLPFLLHPPATNIVFSPRHFSGHAMLRDVTLPGGALLYRQAQPYGGFWYLRSGMVGLYHALKNGKEVLVRTCQRHEWFGFAGLPGNAPYHCTARVLHDALLYHVIPQDPAKFLLHFPAFRQFMLKQMAGALADAEHRMAWIARYRTRHRVLSSLWYLTHYFPDYAWTWREVAEFAGCETETALRFSRELKEMRILDGTQRRLHVRYPDRLAALLD